jgi:hypothetical protein
MKNREMNFPTPEELYAIEQRARVMRAVEMSRVLRALVSSLKSALARAGQSHAPLRPDAKGIRHA